MLTSGSANRKNGTALNSLYPRKRPARPTTALNGRLKGAQCLNRVAACLMHTCDAHGATDVTEFNLLGHVQNLASHQKNEVSFVSHNLPDITKMAETSGGLRICLPREQTAANCTDIEKQKVY